MTDEQHHDPGPVPEPERPDLRPETVGDMVRRNLEEAALPDPVKDAVREALADETVETAAGIGRIYLESVAVQGFRGIGPRSRLALRPRPGVNLVTGRNGSGKSSLAEAIETAFTGQNPRGDTERGSAWRNLHDNGSAPSVAVRMSVAGDGDASKLTRSWHGESYADSTVVFRRHGQGEVPIDEAGWAAALADNRPFLSYGDLDRMVSGRPSQMYDAIATILGLDELSIAHRNLSDQVKALTDAEKIVKDAVPSLREALGGLPDDERAGKALRALEGSYDLDALDELLSALPTDEAGLISRLRAEAEVQGPDLEVVGPALDRLRLALAGVEDLHGSDAEDARRHANLLAQAVEHYDSHPYAELCPVCGTDGVLGPDWVREATSRIANLRQEAEKAQSARDKLRAAVRSVHDLVRPPARIPDAIATAWRAWSECRTIDDPALLATRAEEASLTLSDVCLFVATRARQELDKRDERWRALSTRLSAWVFDARAAAANRNRRLDLTRGQKWVKGLIERLRGERMAAFTGQTQRIWEELRQESNVALTNVSLKGTERATVRKLVMDVSVDGADASALSVMSQGELHSLALSLFLPRVSASGGPFGFVVIDDPVQSMDPAKVNGLARVLAELGKTRQVIVFTHDTRLQRAFVSQELPVTVYDVSRHERSRVHVKVASDPVEQALSDAHAIARTEQLPSTAQGFLLAGLCRTALENAFLEAVWIRHHREGGTDGTLLREAAATETLVRLAALAMFGTAGRTRDNADVYWEIRARYGGFAVPLVEKCQAGAHGSGALPADPVAFVRDVDRLAKAIRKPQSSQQ